MIRHRAGLAIAAVLVVGLLAAIWLPRALSPKVAMPRSPVRSEDSLAPTAASPSPDSPMVAADQSATGASDSTSVPPIRRVVRRWSPIDTYPNVLVARDALVPAAEAGDVRAMVALARSLAVCRDGFADPHVLATLKREAAKAGEVVSEELDEQAAKASVYCNLPADETVTLYRRWLLEAAERGDAEAEIYAIFNPPIQTDFVTWSLAHQDDSGEAPWAESVGLQVKYAERAAERGEVLAVAWLTRLTGADGFSDGDPVVRYENSVLLDEISRASGKKPESYLLSTRSRGLLPVVMEMAQDRAHHRFLATSEWIDRPALTPEQQAFSDEIMARAQAASQDAAASR